MLYSKTQLLLIFLIFYAAATGIAQIPVIDWEYKIGSTLNDVANDVIENKKGELVIVGSSNSWFKGKRDVFFLILDKYQKQIVKSNIGWEKEETAHAVTQTFDGGYILVGSTESEINGQQEGKKDALIIKTDEWGEVLWSKILGTAEDDEWLDVVQNDEGELIATGYFGKKGSTVKFDAKGELLWQQWNNMETSVVGEALLIDDGAIVVTGYLQNANQVYSAFLEKYTSDGKLLWRKTFAQAKAMSIIKNRVGDYLLTGYYNSYGERDNMLFLKTDQDGKQLQLKSFGGRERDVALDMIQTFEGDYISTGHSRSFIRGAKKKKMWVHRIDEDGNPLNEDGNYFGGGRNDIGRQLIQMADGSIVTVGSSESGSVIGTDVWVMKFQADSIHHSLISAQIQASALTLIDENGNGVLEVNERGYFSFDLENVGESPAYELEAKVKQAYDIVGLEVYPTVSFGHLAPGEKRKVSIPIYGNKRIENESNTFKIDLFAADVLLLENLEASVESRREAHPTFVLTEPIFNINSTSISRNEATTFSVEIQNTGNKKAENVRVIFSFDRNIQGLSNKQVEIDELIPGAKRKVEFRFLVESVYVDDGSGVSIGCSIREKTGKYGKRKQVFTTEINKVIASKPEPLPEQQDFINIEWLKPSESNLDNIEIEHLEKKMTISAKVLSNHPIQKSSFKILTNRVSQKNGEKSDVNQICIFEIEEKDLQTNLYAATCHCSLPLTYGLNKIDLWVNNDAGRKKAPDLMVNRPIIKPNLFVLAVGVPDEGGRIKYPAKDAQDFAHLFAGQEQGDLFDKVNILLLNTAENTKVNIIKENINDLYHAFDVGLIQPTDMIVLFFSTHGEYKKIGLKPAFLLHASDVIAGQSRVYSINFEIDIIDALFDVACNKLILIDACQSGTIEDLSMGVKSAPPFDDRSEALIHFIESDKAFRTIVSCSANENSYEDNDLQNGIFTQGLIDAFQNEEVAVARGNQIKANTDDAYLTTTELFAFLQKRIPFLLKNRKPKAYTTQNPFMPQQHRNENLPIFFLGSK